LLARNKPEEIALSLLPMPFTGMTRIDGLVMWPPELRPARCFTCPRN